MNHLQIAKSEFVYLEVSNDSPLQERESGFAPVYTAEAKLYHLYHLSSGNPWYQSKLESSSPILDNNNSTRKGKFQRNKFFWRKLWL